MLDHKEKNADDTIFKKAISNLRWVSHFSSIFQDPHKSNTFPANTNLHGDLDREISDSEIKLGTCILCNGKAPGFDSISNEMLQYLLGSACH